MDSSRPSDHVEQDREFPFRSDVPAAADTSSRSGNTDDGEGDAARVTQPALGPAGYLRFFWRQLTSMRTALLLLLLLAVAAVPGSLFPQRSSDPNGVVQYRENDPQLFDVLNTLQLFDVYTSVWFSAIYLLLFLSLIGCVLPRTRHHLAALRSRPPRTPARLQRLSGFTSLSTAADAGTAVDEAATLLKKQGYRVERYADGASTSVSAERGYLRETGNLVFHAALVGILIAVGIGGGFAYNGQRVIVEGASFTNLLTSYDSFTEGRFFDEGMLEPFSVRLDEFDAEYTINRENFGPQPLDYTASVTTTTADGEERAERIKVNAPLSIGGTQAYLLGNGFAPVITVRDANGDVAFSQAVPFLPFDANLSSTGVVKVPDAQPDDLAFIGLFYPSATSTASGALTSIWPEPDQPLLTLNLYTGDLGLDEGIGRNAYELNVDDLTKRTGTDTDEESLVLEIGDTVDLPDGLGSVTFEELRRFVSIDFHRDPTQGWVLAFAVLAVAGIVTGLFVPRRRVWVKALHGTDGTVTIEYAGLARGDDPGLDRAVADVAEKHRTALERRMST